MGLNRKVMNRTRLVLLAVMMILATFVQFQKVEAAFDLEAESAVLIDAKSGKILFQKNIDQTLPTASMTKMMSEYLILEAVNSGKISWDQEVPISDFVRSLSLETELSNVPLRQDETYTVKELYESVAIYSANASTIALAELIAGTETAFVKMMNDKGTELGLEDFEFVNATGLNNSDLKGHHPDGTGENAENVMSARATAKLAYAILRDYPEVLDTASIPKLDFKAGPDEVISMENWNWMLEGVQPQHDYEGADGLKTGYTAEAGNAFTGTAEREGMRLITVVMRTDSRDARFNETKKLLDYGFNHFTQVELIPKGFMIEGSETLPVTAGKQHEVKISTSEALTSIVKNGEEENYSPELKVDDSLLDEEGKLEAPIEAGQKVGSLSLVYNGEQQEEFLFDSQKEAVPAVTEAAVEKAGWFSMTMRAMGGFFSGIWNGVASTVKGWFS